MEKRVLGRLESRWEVLLKEGQVLNFRKGQVLVYEGHAPYGLFVIESGHVQFSRGEHSCRQQDHLWKSPKGAVIGLRHFFEESPFCCTCTATENCRLVFISRSHLTPFLKPLFRPVAVEP